MKLSDELRDNFAWCIPAGESTDAWVSHEDEVLISKAADELDRLTAKEAEWQAIFGLSEKWAHEKDSADVGQRLRRLAESIRNGTANASENFDLIDTIIHRLDAHRHERARNDALANHCGKHDLPRPTYWQTEDGLRIIELQDELDRLTSALPKTADGVTIVPGMEVWQRASIKQFEVVSVDRKYVEVASLNSTNERCFTTSSDRFYSTRQAAEEAAKGGQDHE